MGDVTREVAVTRRVISYVTEQVNLYDHLTKNLCEMYISNETSSVEIRFPTRAEHVSHYVGHIPFSALLLDSDINGVRDAIRRCDHNKVIEHYIDDIVWAEGYNGTVTHGERHGDI